MRSAHLPATLEAAEHPLSSEELVALQKACVPNVAGFPALDVIRVLRQQGYVQIVIGGLAATEKGLERLIRERRRQAGHRAIR